LAFIQKLNGICQHHKQDETQKSWLLQIRHQTSEMTDLYLH